MTSGVPAGSLYKFLSHKRKVLSLYKRSLRHLECWCADQYGYGRTGFCYERTLLRARFDKYKNETDFKRATQLLRLGEEEFWENQHPFPLIFPEEPGGVMYERSWTHQLPETTMDHWEPQQKAMFPDYFDKREKWCETRMKTWPDEMKWLKESDKQNIEKGVSLTDELPAAKEKDGYPPFWWKTVTRALERPKVMTWFPKDQDSY
nr:NADH dehydrogenase [ubiquinone] 1 beta subcomplex subunit 9-like [Ciona intestinalis]|eukprot:XP_002130843.1 NADH dehydrogenase [ubiquinone] 1 beta subcomplex subunit 9-like [Ciona intestinalis]